MAVLRITFFSQALMRTVPATVILPVDKLTMDGKSHQRKRKFKTLYLLHGILGSCDDWINQTRIQRYAEDSNLAVVMPSGENACYLDQESMHNLYEQYIGKELVQMTRQMFPLSHKKEDTYIGGLSMGGYGAFHNGLKYHDTFGAIIGLSSAFITDNIHERTNSPQMFMEKRDYAEVVFGNLDKVNNSDKNTKYLINKLFEENVVFPKIFISCGTSDPFYEVNSDMVDFLKKKSVEIKFDSKPGGHDWEFWDVQIQEAINWLTVEKKIRGIGSGNIGI